MDAATSLAVGAIVQIDPAHDAEGFGGCLLTVTKVKTWGVQGFVQIPAGGQAHYRVEFRHIEPTGGQAVWVTKGMAADMGETS